MYVLFASYGNDSIALIQYAHINKIQDVHVVYSDTGWAAPWWGKRVLQGETLAASYGFTCYRTKSEGMIPLVKRKKGWPMGGGGAFCTAELKVLPGLAWLEEHDTDCEATCLTGVRRAESANRATAPEWVTESEIHGGRELWQPLVRHSDEERNRLILDAGFEVLPHRSMECYPCVHANRDDLLLLDKDRIELIDITEQEMGFNSKGNYRAMFRPKRHKGAVGIKSVIEWAKAPRRRDQQDLFEVGQGAGCNSGWCES